MAVEVNRVERATAAELERLADALGSQKFRIRRAAVDRLAQIGGDRAVQLIRVALADPRKQVRARAARSLGTIGRHDTLHDVAAVLCDRTASVRSEAVTAVARLATLDEARPLILPLLSDPDVAVVCAAIY